MDIISRAWLAGILEGEGSFMRGPPSRPHSPIVTVSMTDEDIIKRVSVLLGVAYWPEKKRKKWKQSFRVTVKGKKAMAVMRELKPFMGKRRLSQIEKAESCYEDKTSPRKLTMEQAEEIRLLGKQGLSTRQIADKYPVSNVTVSKILKGERYSK